MHTFDLTSRKVTVVCGPWSERKKERNNERKKKGPQNFAEMKFFGEELVGWSWCGGGGVACVALVGWFGSSFVRWRVGWFAFLFGRSGRRCALRA